MFLRLIRERLCHRKTQRKGAAVFLLLPVFLFSPFPSLLLFFLSLPFLFTPISPPLFSLCLSLLLCHESPRYLCPQVRPWILHGDSLSVYYRWFLLHTYFIYLSMWFEANRSKVIFVSPALSSIFRDYISTKASEM